MIRRTDDPEKLKYQAQGRPLSPPETALTQAMVKHFAAGTHDFAARAAALQADGVVRPSGAVGAWTEAVLEAELRAINQELDRAEAESGFGA